MLILYKSKFIYIIFRYRQPSCYRNNTVADHRDTCSSDCCSRYNGYMVHEEKVFYSIIAVNIRN